MKSVVVFLCIVFCCSSGFAAECDKCAHLHKTAGSDAAAAESLVRTTEKGLFRLEMSVAAPPLKSGVNTLDLVVRDKGGKEVVGATLVVTPWATDMGRGVWEKPVVTERGNGKYHVENVSIIMDGRWDLKVAVSKDSTSDSAAFRFDVSGKEQESGKVEEKPRTDYTRAVKSYNVPNVTLLNQDGKKLNFRDLIDSGKPVIIDFIFTTCTTICPVLSASFANLSHELGADADKVQLISISIDPENDRPEQMKKYLSRFRAGKGWDFLTGSRDDITRVLKSLDANITDKMSHEPLYVMHAPHSDDWVRIKGLVKKGDLARELRRIEGQ